MIKINPKPESSPIVVRPYKDETLQSLLARKRFVAMLPLPLEITLPNLMIYKEERT